MPQQWSLPDQWNVQIQLLSRFIQPTVPNVTVEQTVYSASILRKIFTVPTEAGDLAASSSLRWHIARLISRKGPRAFLPIIVSLL